MIDLAILACLASGGFKEVHLIYDAHDVSQMRTCMAAGQVEVALWQQQHSAWQVRLWHCSTARQQGQVL